MLVDTVKVDFFDEFIEKIKSFVDPKDLNYVVLNHLEPDHSGALSKLLELVPYAKVICTTSGVRFTKAYFRRPFE